MKKNLPLLGLALMSGCATAGQQAAAPKPDPQPPTPVTIQSAPADAGQPVYTYHQNPVSGAPVLVSPEQAQKIIERFKAGYAKLGNPRLLIHVNRALVDERSGFNLASHTQRRNFDRTTVNSTIPANANAGGAVNIKAGGNVNLTGGTGPLTTFPPGPGTVTTTRETGSEERKFNNTPRPAATLVDQQTVRDVERLFGRPLRMGGAQLTDQRVTTQLLPNRSLDDILQDTNSESARKDREALARVADVALEILISSRRVVVDQVSGPREYEVPDIHATAIQLRDSRILGQASASDVIGKDRYAARVVNNFDVREITEAVALALMEDMMLSVP